MITYEEIINNHCYYSYHDDIENLIDVMIRDMLMCMLFD